MKPKILILLLAVLIAACNLQAQNDTKPVKDNKMNSMKSNTEPLKVGEIAPDFTLNDQTGKPIQLSKAKSPVVLVFYRGYW